MCLKTTVVLSVVYCCAPHNDSAAHFVRGRAYSVGQGICLYVIIILIHARDEILFNSLS